MVVTGTLQHTTDASSKPGENVHNKKVETKEDNSQRQLSCRGELNTKKK
jgi:hypothetical protein